MAWRGWETARNAATSTDGTLGVLERWCQAGRKSAHLAGFTPSAATRTARPAHATPRCLSGCRASRPGAAGLVEAGVSFAAIAAASEWCEGGSEGLVMRAGWGRVQPSLLAC